MAETKDNIEQQFINAIKAGNKEAVNKFLAQDVNPFFCSTLFKSEVPLKHLAGLSEDEVTVQQKIREQMFSAIPLFVAMSNTKIDPSKYLDILDVFITHKKDEKIVFTFKKFTEALKKAGDSDGFMLDNMCIYLANCIKRGNTLVADHASGMLMDMEGFSFTEPCIIQPSKEKRENPEDPNSPMVADLEPMTMCQNAMWHAGSSKDFNDASAFSTLFNTFGTAEYGKFVRNRKPPESMEDSDEDLMHRPVRMAPLRTPPPARPATETRSMSQEEADEDLRRRPVLMTPLRNLHSSSMPPSGSMSIPSRAQPASEPDTGIKKET